MRVAAPWLRGPWFDTALLSFCWVPVLLWVVLGLGLGRNVVAMPYGVIEGESALGSAILVVLALTFVHRHYTFVLVYGDRSAFRERAPAYVVAPVLMFGVLALVVNLEPIGGVRPVMVALVVSGVWNVWHTVQQRYGILRAYAGRAKRGLEERAHARRDRALIWGAVVVLALVLPRYRAETFALHANAQRVLAVLESLTSSPAYDAVVVLALLVYGAVVWRWVVAERLAPLSLRERSPRLVFLASTFALFAVFVIYGPIVGYLCFGAAHALEYLAFVHHYAERRFGGARRSVAAVLLGRPLVSAPVLVATLLFFYFVLREAKTTEAYLTYYLGTSMLHFLYDGWIWKLRAPSVAAPLGVSG